MKKQVLRLGNMLNHKGLGIYKVTEIKASGISLYKKSEENCFSFIPNNYLDSLEPIKITKEILSELGFNLDINESYKIAWINKTHKFEIHSDNNISWKLYKYNGGFRHLYYVHQLQNLYYALTGEEIIYKTK